MVQPPADRWLGRQELRVRREHRPRKGRSATVSSITWGTGSSNPSSQDYYGGLDLGQKRDYSVVAVILKKNLHYFLVHMHQFPLHTEYLEVLAYLTRVQERFQKMRAWYIDRTGVGEPFPELATKSGLRNVQGVELSLPKKQDLMTNLKQ